MAAFRRAEGLPDFGLQVFDEIDGRPGDGGLFYIAGTCGEQCPQEATRMYALRNLRN